jgi:hypothetical protein
MARGLVAAAVLLTLSFAVVPVGGSPSTFTFEDDVGVPEAVAWRHPIGEPVDAASKRPKPRTRCIDDGEFAGAPLGGMVGPLYQSRIQR